MTEAEWLACNNPGRMLHFLDTGVGARKLRLFACACVRAVWHMLDDDRSREAVVLAERFADGAVTRKQLASIPTRDDARNAATTIAAGAARKTLLRSARMAANDASSWVVRAQYALVMKRWEAARAQAEAAQCDLLRDLVGNPFRPAVEGSAWRVPAVLYVARGIYEERDFAGLPVLADALEEAGCPSEALLAHFRGQGTHARGCWALDAVLGME